MTKQVKDVNVKVKVMTGKYMQTASGKVKSQSFRKGTKVTNLSSVT